MADQLTSKFVLVLVTLLWTQGFPVVRSEDNECPYDGFGQLVINKADYIGKDNTAASSYCLNGYFVFTNGLPNVTLQTDPLDRNNVIIQAIIGEKRGAGVIRKTTKVDHARWDIVNPSRALDARNGGPPETPRWIVVRPPTSIDVGIIRGERRGNIIRISSRGANRISRKLA